MPTFNIVQRVVALAMAAVVCFVLIVPLALQRHQPGLAIVVSLLFVAYLAVNVALWLRYRRR